MKKAVFPNVLEEAQKAFDVSTGNGANLWPDQQTAYKAGYSQAIWKMKNYRTHLKWPSRWIENSYRAFCRTSAYKKNLVLTDIKKDVNCIKCLEEMKKQEQGK